MRAATSLPIGAYANAFTPIDRDWTRQGSRLRDLLDCSADEYEHDVVDDIGVITLNRPEKMNAMSASLLDELADRFSTAKADPAVSVVLLQGAAGCSAPATTLASDDRILSQDGADFEGAG